MSKTLKTIVKLDTKSAVSSLDRLEKKIRQIETVVNKTSNTGNKFSTSIKKATTDISKLDSQNKKAANSANKIAQGYQKSSKAASVLTKNLRTLISTYVGIQGAQAVLNASDVITSAKNKLNYLNGGDASATKLTMDKTYAAAQRSRGSYSDMISNVSKSMTLAGESFQGNVDNAIRFQEIMSKAYTIGGASASEQSSSMYQLIQALGSGVLQGDELRSVREGAPLAYKAIEEFAQGVYKTEDSLKDLASQGKITSDMVVAAVMDMGESVDKAFKKTDMTFAQAWNSVKNMALQAFRPVLEMLNKALNSDVGKAAIEGIGKAFIVLANIILWVGGILGSFFNWFSENWYWLQWVVFAVVTALVVHLTILAAKAVWTGITSFISFLLGLSPLFIWIIVIGLVVAALVWLANTAVSGMQFIVLALLIVAAGLVLVAVLTQAWWLLWVALAIIVVAALLVMADKIVGAVYWIGAVGYNCFVGIANVVIALSNVVEVVTKNIGIFFSNAWNGALSSFWTFIASCMEGLDWLAQPLEKIAELFGKSFDYEGFTSGLWEKAQYYDSKQKDYLSVGDAWRNGMNTYEYKDLSDAYDKGAAVGAGWQDAVGNWGNNLKDKVSGFSVGDLFGGLDTSKLTSNGSYLPDPNLGLDITNGTLDDINGNVGDIKDEMDLSNDDLEYLRKIAEMDWRNEFTTAEIRVDMTNNNTVTSDRDLDGIVEYLSDVLREEMTSVAYGVHI